ncbi:glycoside hydrolase family 43 protein [Sphingomonas sediminicola]|uniref:glycoside hydrolase family 43 protein n=1 Tax=Sphingomonas sediminicola TaxID=386874 RepID=UPI001CA6CA9B|nr:glycoside hydrolase family 43 protein [Sphingomonas sediminicola]
MRFRVSKRRIGPYPGAYGRPIDSTGVAIVDRATATYINPVLDADFPDPAAILAPDGYYYAYATQTLQDDKWINIQVARSRDLVQWDHLGDALPDKPGWARDTQDFWAPYVVQEGDRYLMYYSATPDVCDVPERGHCLAIATASSPVGPFVDMGLPLLLGMGFEYIDPMVFDDPVSGQRFLYWGSGFQPIKVQQLAEDHMSFVPDSEPTDIIWPNSKGGFPRLVEAAWVIHHDDFYYIFYSGDNCCGPDAEYGVMVARSREPTGPFETLEEARGVPHSLMLFKSERWLAPGHNCIVTDKAGENWIIYHAIDVNRPRQRQEDEINSRRILLIDKIQWRDGWPFVGTPSDDVRDAPVV